MRQTFDAVKIAENIYWVGAIDWTLTDFHGYAAKRGTTYNAYLIIDEKIALIDAVKAKFKDELLARISSVVEPEKIDYIVSNHSEMDHSGCLPQIIKAAKPEKVFASAMGVKALTDHFGALEGLTAVKDGGKLSLGALDLVFTETRMLHWPDSMFTYVPQRKILFSQDGFGMHLASLRRFDDEEPAALLEEEAARYYANIVQPYSPVVAKLLEKVAQSGLEIKIIAPDHGPVWRQNPSRIINLYGKWARGVKKRKVVVVYDTMWNSTECMAQAIAEAAAKNRSDARLLSLKSSHRSDVMAELLDAPVAAIGSPTLNNNMYPTIADLTTYMRGLKPKLSAAAAFGSYGWSGEGSTQAKEALAAMKAEIIGEVKCRYLPTDKTFEECELLGKALAERAALSADKE